MLACAGYLLTMVADCVVSSVFTSDEKAGDLELQGGVGQGNGTKNGGTSQSQNQERNMLIHFMLALDKQAPPWM
nr:hypothetical protein CFP56_42691 [Quercus suber]